MLVQEYIQLIRVLSDEKFLEFSKLFILSKYNGNNYSIEDCQWNNTYILSFNRNRTEIKRFIHISYELDDLKTFLYDNLESISNNSNNKVYRKLECICKSQIENKEDIVEKADFEYGITIAVYDLETIGNIVEENKVLKDFLFQSSDNSQDTTKFDRENKLLYDIFTTSKKIADIKNSFIGSYIQYYLLEKSELSLKELELLLSTPLPNISSRAIKDAMNKYINEDDIIIFDKGKYRLSDSFKNQLVEMKSLTIATEQRLLKQFVTCLDKYGLKDISHDILNTILNLYKEQNNAELATLSHNDQSDQSEKHLVNGLIDTLKANGITHDVNSIVRELLDIISDSEYLNKVSATTLFTSLFNSNSLEDYLSTQKRIVFLDTQILLQLMCVDYLDVNYDDSLYRIGQILHSQFKESSDYLNLFTTHDYVREVSNHLYEAYNLKRFVTLSYIKELGPSKNVFYNYFLYLDQYGPIDYDNYEDYLKELLNTDDDLPSDYYSFVEVSDRLIVSILEGMKINIQHIDAPSNLDSLTREYDIILDHLHRDERKSVHKTVSYGHPKLPFARRNDVLCMYYLSDKSNFLNKDTELREEPFFVTMDSTIVPLRDKLVKSYSRDYWYVYPPLKFANRLSIMDLKLDSNKINYDIICMAETNFKASNETKSMLDVMSIFFRKSELGNNRLTRELAKLREQERKNDDYSEFLEKNNYLPIDVALNDIHRHYRSGDYHNLDNVVKLFEIENLSDQIVKLIKKGCNQIVETKVNRLDNKIFIEFDNLIKEFVLSSSNDK